MTIVTTHYRYKRPPRKKKAAAMAVPIIVRKRGVGPVGPHGRFNHPSVSTTGVPANDDRKSAIVTARKPGRSRFADVPDMTPEEHERRGDAADALFRELVRQATGKR